MISERIFNFYSSIAACAEGCDSMKGFVIVGIVFLLFAYLFGSCSG